MSHTPVGTNLHEQGCSRLPTKSNGRPRIVTPNWEGKLGLTLGVQCATRRGTSSEGIDMKLTQEALRDLTDRGSWERGLEYFEEDRVRSLVEDGGTVFATVEGQRLYRVRLTVLEDRVLADCSCPMGKAGVFCKHCVAVGLTYIEGASSDGRAAGNASDDPLTDLDRIRQHLAGMDRSALEEMILDQALWDEGTMQRLIMESASQEASLDTKAMKRVITDATRTGGFVDYRRAGDFAMGIDQVVRGLGKLLEAGFAEEAIPLIEYALRRVERALLHMDDSDGHMSPILDGLQTLHHAACVAAEPNPIQLARRILDWELNGDWDTFYNAARIYADLLGEAGLAEYRKRAEAEWEQVPALGPGQERETFGGNRYRLTGIMEALATESGDLDALIEVMRRNLSSTDSYLRIAEACKAAGESDRAVAWAESGIEAFPDKTDPRLCEFLVLEYRQLGREEDALDLAWRSFVDRPGLGEYQKLKAQVDRLDNWPAWREKALDQLQNEESAHDWFKPKVEWRSGPVVYGSPLVAVFLWENAVEAAWEEARKGGCSLSQWLELAERREDEHPEDALRVRQDDVARLVNLTNNAAYEEAIEQVESIRRLLRRNGQEGRFQEYVATLQREFKRKRNFMKMLSAYT